jgi:hypothetical protein
MIGISIALLCLLKTTCPAVAEPQERIIQLDAFTRTDVPKLRIHVMKWPSLEKVKEADTNMNVTAYPRQIGTTPLFAFFDNHYREKFFQLNDDYQFVTSDHGPSGVAHTVTPKQRASYDSNTTITVHTDGKPDIKCEVPKAVWGTYDGFHFFNGGQSLACNAGVSILVVKDLKMPKPEVMRTGGFSYQNPIGDPNRPYFFATLMTQANDKTSYTLVRIDPTLSANNIRRAVDLGTFDSQAYRPCGKIEYDQTSGRFLVLTNKGPNSYTVDPDSGKAGPTFALTSSESFAGPRQVFKIRGRNIALFDNREIDLESGKAVGILPGFFPISDWELTPDGKMLLYSSPEKADTMRFTKLVAYDLEKGRTVNEVTLSGPWDPKGAQIPSVIKGMYFLPEKKTLVILSGCMAMFSDHIHTTE